MELKNGIVRLSGFCETTFYVGINNDEPVDGFIMVINGINYAAYVDPDDGYRSYGAFFQTDKPCTNTFPAQELLLETADSLGGYDWYEDPKRQLTLLKNPETGETVLQVGTTWYDSYYPMGVCYFNPKAMPINKNKYEGATMIIIASWNRDNGDKIIIAKSEETGECIEGIVLPDGRMKFTPIKNLKINNERP